MTGDSQSLWDGLRRRGSALIGGVFLFALCGCALSFEDQDGQRHVVGLYSMASEEAADAKAPADVVRRFSFYGVWADDAFRGTSIAFGAVELAVADLRNQWRRDMSEAAADDGCDGGFLFRWCTFRAPSADRAGTAFDIAVSGVTIGVGERDRHFGVGYHRQVLLEVTNENALVTWPAQVGLEGLLRGSFNG